MKHETYKRLRLAYLGDVNIPALYDILRTESDPFIHRAVHLVAKTTSVAVPWDVTPFTSRFQDATPHERLHETVMVFLLRMAAIIKEEIHIRTFRKPESHAALQAWVSFFKETVFAVLTLLYNVRWSVDHFFGLEAVTFELLFQGQASALRDFMTRELQIALPDRVTQAEHLFEKLNFLTINQFGSSFWRLLHWMAEAMDMRHPLDDIPLAKQVWRQLITDPLYRLLRCGICMAHMRQIVQDSKPQLLNSSTQYRQLWFNIHNKVTANKFDPTYARETLPMPYSESQLDSDGAFMKKALEA